MINESLLTGIVPDKLKIAKITPLFKSGDPKSYNNYRPISILPCLSKIYEKVIYIRLIYFINKNKILSKCQYGFRSNHSTSLAVVDFLEKMITSIDKGYYSLGVFLDLSKAFDTVNHKILLTKLEFYGVRGVALKWFENYLSNRKQYVEYKNEKSKLFEINCGVPQGSILGHILFLLYFNDIINSTEHLSFTLFADDTNVFYKSKSLDELNKTVNKELTNLSPWFRSNKLSLNINKTKFILFTNKKKVNNNLINIKIDSEEIKRVSVTKFLGMIIDEHLTWKPQIKHLSSKISRNIGSINKIKYYLPKHALKTLYYSMIYPYLLYGNIVWASTYKTNINRLQILQKKAIRIITNSDYLSHTSDLFEKEKILTIKGQINPKSKKIFFSHFKATKC